MNFDYTLYLVTNRQLMSCDSLTEAVEQAILGGCTMIQLREKELSSLEFYNQAVAVKWRFKPMGIDGLAVVSAIIAQSDIKAAAAELKDLFCGKEKKNGF